MAINKKLIISGSRMHAAARRSIEELEEEEMELRRGPWTVEEDLTLINFITKHGDGRWNSLARSAGLKRTGKSCRLRWLNYLRPDVRRGNITLEEQLLILELHSRWGNRWSKIAQRLPGRTDNEIKNYWRTRVQKQAKQLQCDVNSKKFQDVIRCLWMPRLLERIHHRASSTTTSNRASSSTTKFSSINVAMREMIVKHNEEHDRRRITSCSELEGSSTQQDHSITNQFSSPSSESDSFTGCHSTMTQSSDHRNQIMRMRDEAEAAAAGLGMWTEPFTVTTQGYDHHQQSTLELQKFDSEWDFGDSFWSLEDIWSIQ